MTDVVVLDCTTDGPQVSEIYFQVYFARGAHLACTLSKDGNHYGSICRYPDQSDQCGQSLALILLIGSTSYVVST